MDPKEQQPLDQKQETIKQEESSKEPGYFSRMINGRLHRKNYAVGSLLTLIFPILMIIVDAIVLALNPSTQMYLRPIDTTDPIVMQRYLETSAPLFQNPLIIILSIISIIYMLIIIPFSISLQVRRLHDFNQSGWFILVNLVPVLNYIFPIYVALNPGSKGKNNYGEQPTPEVRLKEDVFQMR